MIVEVGVVSDRVCVYCQTAWTLAATPTLYCPAAPIGSNGIAGIHKDSKTRAVWSTEVRFVYPQPTVTQPAHAAVVAANITGHTSPAPAPAPPSAGQAALLLEARQRSVKARQNLVLSAVKTIVLAELYLFGVVVSWAVGAPVVAAVCLTCHIWLIVAAVRSVVELRGGSKHGTRRPHR